MPRGPSYDVVVTALMAQWQLIAAALPGLDPTAPTPLPGWDTATLVGHLAGTAERVVTLTGAPCPGEARLDAVTWWVAEDAAEPDGRGDAARFAAATAAATAVLAATPDARVIAPGIRLAEYARTRVLEAVVHGLDLGVPPDPGALRLTVRLLGQMLEARLPGRNVEVRVPPYAAVQVLAGPRHTRGTPPGVVEADPEAFVLLCTGRLGWAEGVADGRVRASGERTDLSPHLPILR